MRLKAFTLIELLITMTIIVLMALVAIPAFGKHQRLIEFQDKSDEVRAKLNEMQLKATNPEKGMIRYYAQIDDTNNDLAFYSYDSINRTLYQKVILDAFGFTGGKFLVCDTGSKSYCCIVTNFNDVCTTPANNIIYLSIGSDASVGKTSQITIYSNPFKVNAVIVP